MSFLTSLLESSAASGLAEKIGVSPDKIASLIPSVAPMILGAVQKNAGDDDEKVEQLLEKHGAEDGSADPADLLGADGAGKATDVISSKLGVSAEAAKGFLPKIISFVMGLLNKKKGEAGGGMDAIRGFLDKDGDGSMLNDLGGMLGGGEGGGGLGKLAGGLFGGGK
ncbi:MAG: hypothetical protein ACI8UO_002968 [Verrucomicrobiales bacterium]|jgi:hypothetical protein